MTVLEAIEQLTAQKKADKIEPVIVTYRDLYDRLAISWAEMVEELERLESGGIVHLGDTSKCKYVKLL